MASVFKVCFSAKNKKNCLSQTSWPWAGASWKLKKLRKLNKKQG
jgi:hypothetical protein